MKLSIILFLVIKCILLCNVNCLHQLNYEQPAKRLYQYDPPRPLFAPPPKKKHMPGDDIKLPSALLKPSLERNNKLYSGYPRRPPHYSMDYLKNKYYNQDYAARQNELKQTDNEKTRDWMSQHLNTLNFVTVPPNCPSGQPDKDGFCRDVWPLREPPSSQKESAKRNDLTQAEKEKIRIWMSEHLTKLTPAEKEKIRNWRSQKLNDLTQAEKEKIHNWMSQHLDTLNFVTVPPNCPSGQPDKDGFCRDVWPLREQLPPSLIKVSTKETKLTPAEKEKIRNWKSQKLNDLTQAEKEKIRIWMSKHLDTLNFVTVPPNCPSGQPDKDGFCRDVWPLREPPSSQKEGAKRNDLTQAEKEKIRIWMSQHLSKLTPAENEKIRNWISQKMNQLTEADNEKTRDWMSQHLDTLNFVTVPPNCPSGQPDKDGYCRDVWPRRIPLRRSQESSGQFQSAETTAYLD